jgi:hypothetical protein
MDLTTDQPEFERADLTDELYQEMIKNPDRKIPFLLNWARVSRLAPVGAASA